MSRQHADARGRASQEPFVTTDEVAEFLDKPKSWVFNNAGPLGIPRYRIGNHFRYRLSEVAAWVETQAEKVR